MTEVLRTGSNQVLFARARYPNLAEAEDELTFGKDEILQVLQKDYNGQVDWWLCRLGPNEGMVPANYLEIFHPHTPKGDALLTSTEKDDTGKMDQDYAIPKPTLTIVKPDSPPVPISYLQLTGIPLHEKESKYADYDFPTSHEELLNRHPSGDDPTNRDYDLPPPEHTDNHHHDIYDRPPSTKSSRSAFSNRVSVTSIGSSQLYDIPPTSPSAIYDVPPSDLLRSLTPSTKEHSRPPSGEGMDLSNMYENEADEYLKKCRSDIDQEFERLWQCVYGNNAYWGSDNKLRRKETLNRTVIAAKDLDRALVSLVDFGKGVNTSLENSSTKDVNFKRKCMAANTILRNKRQEVLSKVEILLEADEKDTHVTATVKALLEVSRSLPQAAQAFLILVQANKALLFKSSKTEVDSLPVLTKTEVKNRPLPEIPQIRSSRLHSGSDYVDIETEDHDITKQGDDIEWKRKRSPQDELPPLPFATLRKPSKKKSRPHDSEDYDVIDGNDSLVNIIHTSPVPPRGEYLVAGNTKGMNARNHLLRQSSGSNHSNSSDGGASSPKRSRTPEKVFLGGPYGYGTMERSVSPSQPLRHEDRDLLTRFSQQMELLLPSLKEAVEVFLETIKNNEIPKQFVTKSKLAVVAAYKLVYIADALFQKLHNNDTKVLVITASNQLTETIKMLVADTKAAALQYPNVLSKEKMLESLRKLFPSALDLVNTLKSPF